MTRTCRVCGCTDFAACPGGCWWVEDDLCSSCAGAGKPEKPEYREFRCCLCPNINEPENTVCPPQFQSVLYRSPFRNEPTPCRFVKTYMDERGWLYRVMPGIGGDEFKTRYQQPGKTGWKCMNYLPWRSTFDEAQSDLNALAKGKGWSEVNA